jgi:3-methyladenine DNA glycosylase AlkD
MSISISTSTIIEGLKAVSETKRRNRSLINFPTSMEILGATSPNMKALIKDWWVELKTWPPNALLDLAFELVKTRILECNMIAFELLWKNKNALELISLSELEILGANMDNWVTTDTFSIMVSGYAWRENQITDADILSWLKSDNRWWRRAALVSTITLNLRARGGKGDPKRTLLICEKVIDERDDMIVKALSWALRELSKSNKAPVEEFMKKYDSRLAGKIRREVYTKLETGRKNG